LNAPANIQRAPRHEDYLPAVATFCPGEPDACHQSRARIMAIRDRASAALNRAGPDAADILGAVVRVATAHCFSPADIETLEELRYQLTVMMAAANKLQALFSSGGRNADG
jgi:hypothetical protein